MKASNDENNNEKNSEKFNLANYKMVKFYIIYFITPWVFGVSLSEGTWETIFAVSFPPFAYALSADFIIEIINKLIGVIT